MSLFRTPLRLGRNIAFTVAWPRVGTDMFPRLTKTHSRGCFRVFPLSHEDGISSKGQLDHTDAGIENCCLISFLSSSLQSLGLM